MQEMTMTDEKDEKDKKPEHDAFTSIDPEKLAPELKELYKSMQADYTRKTQSLASLKSEITEKESKWQDKLKEYGAVEQEVQQWRNWYASLDDKDHDKVTDQAKKAGDLPTYLDEPDAEGLNKYVKDLRSTYDGELASLKKEIESLHSVLRDTSDQTSKMFNYHAQLTELGGKYKDLNKQELLEHALKTGQPDLEKAYRDLHQDKLIEAEVEKRVKEEVEKRRTQGIQGPGRQVIVRTKEGTPKTYTEATEQILRERAAKGL
uniref:Uncharacterized protein n=1 Tax=viral metagenome TaxID=1070528 RepID=A0A6M3K6Z6_9ZZZZ